MNVKSFATLRLTSSLLEVLPDQPILPPARAFETVIQTTTALAHPPYLPGRHAGHQGVIFHVLGHDGTGGDKRALPYRMTAHDRAIRTERCAFAHARTRVDPVHREVRPRGDDVREHAGRTAENVVLQLDAIIDGHVVLDSDAVSDADLARHVHVLSQRAVRTDHSPALDMAEMPNLGAGADGGAGIHVAALVHEIILHLQNFNVVTRGDPIKTDGPETRLRLLYGQRKSNIAEANDPGYVGSVLDFCKRVSFTIRYFRRWITPRWRPRGSE